MPKIQQIELEDLTTYQVVAKACTSVNLPEHSGSLLRGAFGRALKAQQCRCGAVNVHRPDCLYARVFEGLCEQPISGSQPPPRFVIVQTTSPDMVDKKILDFSISLLGLTIREQEDAMSVWPLAFKTGLGESRTRYEPVLIRKLPSDSFRSLPKSVVLDFITPWQIKRAGRALKPEQCTGDDILFAINHRLALLNRHFQLTLPSLPAESLRQLSAGVKAQTSLRQANWKRYSARQKKTHPLAGVTGQVTLSASSGLAPLSAMLQTGQHVNAGGKTSFGLGAYRILRNKS